jgi:hypothetical protein
LFVAALWDFGIHWFDFGSLIFLLSEALHSVSNHKSQLDKHYLLSTNSTKRFAKNASWIYIHLDLFYQL